MARRCCQGQAARLPRLLCGPWDLWGHLQGRGQGQHPHGEARGGERLRLGQRARARLAMRPGPQHWELQGPLGQRVEELELVLALLPLHRLVVQAQARALPLRRLAVQLVVQAEEAQAEVTIRALPRRQPSLPA